MERKPVLLIDMYGVIIKESKGYFIPYTFEHFGENDRERIHRAFFAEHTFTKAGYGDLTSNEFLRYLGYTKPEETMRDYLENYLNLDEQFHSFAEAYAEKVDMILLSNDVLEWSEFLTERYGMNRYFRDKIVSGQIHMRKPEERIYAYVLERIGRPANECIFVDNSSKNLLAAEKFGINTVLFNRDGEEYSGAVVNNFAELGNLLEQKILGGSRNGR